MDGNAFWWVEESECMMPLELWWIPRERVRVEPPKEGCDRPNAPLIEKYFYRSFYSGHEIELPKRNVVHFRFGLDPNNPGLGLSPLHASARTLYADERASNFIASLLRNNAMPGGTVSIGFPDKMQGKFIEEGLATSKRSWEERFSGDRVGSPAFFNAGTTYTRVGFAPNELDMDSTHLMAKERILADFSLNGPAVGLPRGLEQHSLFAGQAEAERAAYQTGIMPLLSYFAATMKSNLLTLFEPDMTNWELEFDVSGVRVLQPDEYKRHDQLVKELRAGLITRKMFRELRGYPLDDDSDTDDVFLLSRAMVPAQRGTDFTELATLTVEQPSALPASESDSASQDDAAKARHAGGFVAKQGPQDDVLIRLMCSLLDVADDMGRQWQSQVLFALDDLGEEAQRAFRAVAPLADDLIFTAGDVPVYDDLVEAIRGRMDYPTWERTRMPTTWLAHYRRTAQATVETINAITNLGVRLPVPVLDDILQRGGTRLGLADFNAKARDSLFKALREGYAQSETPDQLAKRIREQVSAGRFKNADTRAMLITRTETAYVQNQ